jgi:hypothetical protein
MRNITIIIAVFLLISCNSKNKKVENVNKKLNIKDLSGKIFDYAPSIDTIKNISYGECDCCSGSYIFLNDNDFICIDYCESDTFYMKGTFEIVNNELLLKYNGVCVEEEYNWERENDSTVVEYFIKKSKINPSTKILKYFKIKNSFYFKGGERQENFSTIDKKAKLSQIISRLKKDSIWQKLD